ncbi:MAG TPA: DUF2157 domain-containing protein [Coleofasciculaceae cyanobacterium]|jgi:uncharacterized membrane protein
MVTEKFRRQLRQESEKWWSEGLIDATVHEQLSLRYQFQNLEKDASNRFITILMSLGGILLGLAVITFVAANWQDWTRGFKVVLLLSLFIGVNAAGFYLWRSPSPKGYQKLGHGLLLLGALILGANIALMAQMFHQTGDFYELLLVWGLGVVIMAHGLRLVSLSILSLILLSIGYVLGWFDWTGGQASLPWQLIVIHMPLIATLLFLPLAYRSGSRVLFGFSAVLTATALTLNGLPWGWDGGNPTSGWGMAIACTVPPALLWSFSSDLWRFSRTPRRASRPVAPPQPFQAIARSLSLVGLSLILYLLSFRGLWLSPVGSPSLFFVSSPFNWQSLIDLLLFSLVAGLGWLALARQKRSRFQEKFLNSGFVAVMLLLIVGVFVLNFEISPLPDLSTLLINILLFLLAIGLIRDGLALGHRQTFWGGILLLVLGILSRTVEYDTDLLLKSIAFAACGIGVILAGLWFERKVKLHPPKFIHASQEKNP